MVNEDLCGSDCIKYWTSPPARTRLLLPDFLIISPPKTGTTWLTANLSRHPEIYIPDIKELFFFSHFFKDKSWEWYGEQFRPGLGLTKGEASPSYCFLAPKAIELIHSVMPRLRLIYIMREPIARAWSHARHCFRNRQTTFQNAAGPADAPTEKQWRANLDHPSSRRAGFYLAHLQSWLAVFPRQQIFVDFYESIQNQPDLLLSRILAFLGLSSFRDSSGLCIKQRHNEGLDRPIPLSLAAYLREQFAPSTRKLVAFLTAKLGLALPAEWACSLSPSGERVGVRGQTCVQKCPLTPDPSPPEGRGEKDKPTVYPQRPTFAEFEKNRLKLKYTPRLKEVNYFGYNIVYFKGDFFGIKCETGPLDLTACREEDLRLMQETGQLFRSALLERVKMDIAAWQLTHQTVTPQATPQGFTRRLCNLLTQLIR